MIQTPESVVDGGGKTTNEAEATENAKRSSYDILLNNFQIKKKRYRVLLNYDHIVWERWSPEHAKSKQKEKKIKNQKIETEQLSNTVMTNYGSNANIVHLNEIIRVCKGNTKSATLRVDDDSLSPPSDLYIPSSPSPSPSPSTHHPSNTTTTTAITPLAQYLTIHYAERIVKSPIDCNRWHIRCLTLYNTDPYIIAQWFTLLNRKLHENPKRLHIRRLLVFINPYGGRKKGLQTYEIYCKPLFQLAGIDASCVISQRSNQIRDILLTHDLTPYDAICCVGGDGTAAEVINGLIFRAMLDSGMNIQKPPLASYIPKPSIPIGIIPAGSTDTIAYSVHGTSDAQTAAIHLILGQRRGCDICSVRNRQGGVVRFCASVFSYGYLGDVAAKSERYRWMGPKRYEYTGVKAFLTNRGYEAEIRLLLEPPPNSYDEAASAAQFETDKNSDTVCYANCQRCNSVVLSSNSDPDADADEEDSVDYAKPGESNLVGSNPTCEKISNFQDIPGEHSTNVLPTHSDSGTAEDVEKGKGEEVHVKNCDNNDLLTSGGDIIKCDNPICEEEMPIKPAPQLPPPPTTTDERSNKSFSFCSINPTINGDNEIGSNRISGNFTLMPNQPKWKTIRGHFFMISCANITCACSRSPNGISRYNHLGDGQLDVILVRKTSIFNNLRFALNTMGRNGDVRNLPFVETYRTRQMHFHVDSSTVQNTDNLRASTQPIFLDSRTDKLVSSWNCDGEIVHDLDVTVTSHCQLIDVFMRGPYSYAEKNTKRVCCC